MKLVLRLRRERRCIDVEDDGKTEFRGILYSIDIYI